MHSIRLAHEHAEVGDPLLEGRRAVETFNPVPLQLGFAEHRADSLLERAGRSHEASEGADESLLHHDHAPLGQREAAAVAAEFRVLDGEPPLEVGRLGACLCEAWEREVVEEAGRPPPVGNSLKLTTRTQAMRG